MGDELDPSLNVHIFLYLHPNENPALVSPPLDSTSYHSWSRSMITALSAKNKVKFVDGSTPRPLASDRTFGAWKRYNNMVISWLVHSISSSIQQSILWMDCVEEIWRDLKSRCSQGDLLRISALQLEASSIKQGDLAVTDFFTQLRIIWDELEISYLILSVFVVCNALANYLPFLLNENWKIKLCSFFEDKRPIC